MFFYTQTCPFINGKHIHFWAHFRCKKQQQKNWKHFHKTRLNEWQQQNGAINEQYMFNNRGHTHTHTMWFFFSGENITDGDWKQVQYLKIACLWMNRVRRVCDHCLGVGFCCSVFKLNDKIIYHTILFSRFTKQKKKQWLINIFFLCQINKYCFFVCRSYRLSCANNECDCYYERKMFIFFMTK